VRIFYKRTADFSAKLVTLSSAIDIYKKVKLYIQNFRYIQAPSRPESSDRARIIRLIMSLNRNWFLEFLKRDKLML
jgi:hypothetical protein